MANSEVPEARRVHGRRDKKLGHQIVVRQQVVDPPEDEVVVRGRKQMRMQIDCLHAGHLSSYHLLDLGTELAAAELIEITAFRVVALAVVVSAMQKKHLADCKRIISKLKETVR